ncbi:hypothetical protein, partial [Salmonella sp. s55004]|uniref:hypothetical protein n=1 Tax=Salmonella sp. s55004 TaxID=3159675 RepID=UPI0039808F13
TSCDFNIMEGRFFRSILLGFAIIMIINSMSAKAQPGSPDQDVTDLPERDIPEERYERDTDGSQSNESNESNEDEEDTEE